MPLYALSTSWRRHRYAVLCASSAASAATADNEQRGQSFIRQWSILGIWSSFLRICYGGAGDRAVTILHLSNPGICASIFWWEPLIRPLEWVWSLQVVPLNKKCDGCHLPLSGLSEACTLPDRILKTPRCELMYPCIPATLATHSLIPCKLHHKVNVWILNWLNQKAGQRNNISSATSHHLTKEVVFLEYDTILWSREHPTEEHECSRDKTGFELAKTVSKNER